MSSWRGVGSVIAGAFVTIVLGFLTVVALPFLGFATAEVVGNGLPLWIFAVPLVLCPTVGGATTGFFHGANRKRGAMLGSVAAALGISVFGVVFGLLFLLLMLGMTPAHGQVGDLSTAALTMATLGGVAGFIAGAVFGALGGFIGPAVRR